MALRIRNGEVGKVCTICSCWKPLLEFHPRRHDLVPVGDGHKSACKACLNAQRRTKRANDAETALAKQRAYVSKHQEHIRLLKQAHRKAHPDKYAAALERYRARYRQQISARARQRRETTLEHYRALGRLSRARHRPERNAYQRAYSRQHREKMAAYVNRRRSKLHEAAGYHTLQEWRQFKVKYNYTCLCCGRQESEVVLTRDHIVPLDCSGSDSIDNIQPLCASCNIRKGTKTVDLRPG